MVNSGGDYLRSTDHVKAAIFLYLTITFILHQTATGGRGRHESTTALNG